MTPVPSLLALAAMTAYSASAAPLQQDQICMQSIFEATNYLTFLNDDPLALYMNACQNPLKACSIYASGREYCSEREVESGARHLNTTCGMYAFAPLMSVEECTGQYVIDDTALAGMRRVAFGTLDVLEEVVVLAPEYFGAQHRTLDLFQYELRAHRRYGYAMYGFWGIVVLSGILSNLVNSVWHTRVHRGKEKHIEGETATNNESSATGIWRHVRQHVILPPIVGDKHRRLLYSFFVPTRIESFIIFAYWVISLVLCSVNYRTFEGNMYWPTISPQVWRYLGDRTGIMSYANLPILWLFSGRNNIFLWATGWDFGTFNLFHRHIARVATIEAIVHSAAWTVLAMPNGLYDSYLPLPWFYLGILAMVTMSMLFVLSSVWIRRRFYELFLLVHIAFSVLTIVSLFYHTSVFVDREYDGYLWPVVAIWVFDRFLRLARLTYCNVRVLSGGQLVSMTRSTATYDEAADVVKLVVSPARPLLRPRPGQYYFVYQPLRWKGWESHPFTLGAWRGPESEDMMDDSTAAYPSGERPRVPSIGESCEKEASVASSSRKSSQQSVTSKGARALQRQELVFWLRPRNGFTRELRDHCRLHDNFSSTSSIMIEGPYGHHARLHNYENVLLVGGGTGMSGIACYILEHIRRAKAGKHLKTRHIQVVFTCKQEAFIRKVCTDELSEALTRQDIDMQFFTTIQAADGKASSAVDVEKRDARSQMTDDAALTVNRGRPNIHAAVLAEAKRVAEGGSRGGRLAVLVCGPASMADETRKAVRRAIKEHRRNIEYFEETFGW